MGNDSQAPARDPRYEGVRWLVGAVCAFSDALHEGLKHGSESPHEVLVREFARQLTDAVLRQEDGFLALADHREYTRNVDRKDAAVRNMANLVRKGRGA